MVATESRAVAVAEPNPDLGILEKVVVQGDLSKLSTAERLAYYSRLCDSLGLNPLTQPFEYLELNKKLVLYAKKTATDQLRKVHGVNIVDVQHQQIGDIYIVTAHARTRGGIEDVDEGAVNVKGLWGESLANAYMKALTKAKRRVTLSICGLGMLDETEVDTIPGATVAEVVEDWREKYRRKFFAIASGTPIASEEGRARFIAEFCQRTGRDATSSLRAFLTAGTEEDANALVSALELATQEQPAPAGAFEAIFDDDREIDETTGEIIEPAPIAPEIVKQAEDIRSWFQHRIPTKPSDVVSRDDAKFQFDRLSEITGSVVAAGAVLGYLKGKPTLFIALTKAEAGLLDKAVETFTGDAIAAIVPVARLWADEAGKAS